MTGLGFTADPDRIAARAGEFDGHAERAAGILAELDRALEGAERAWGSDQVGQAFQAAHGDPAASTLERIRGLPGGLGDLGHRFADSAGAYRAADHGAADELPGPRS